MAKINTNPIENTSRPKAPEHTLPKFKPDVVEVRPELAAKELRESLEMKRDIIKLINGYLGNNEEFGSYERKIEIALADLDEIIRVTSEDVQHA